MGKKIKRSKNGHVLNWKPGLPDHRAPKYRHSPEALANLPEQVDLRPKCSPVVNQGGIGSCTGNALAGAFEFLELMGKPAEKFGDKFEAVSRLFIYWYERYLEGDTEEDAGAAISDGVDALRTYGACREKTWPYGSQYLFEQPNEDAVKEASHHKVTKYYELNDINDMKQCLANGYPFVFGFSVFESFDSDEVCQTGMVPLPADDEELEGGHAVLCVGYDADKQLFIVRNSWGDDWGDKGYCYFPFRYLTSAGLASDFYTIRK